MLKTPDDVSECSLDASPDKASLLVQKVQSDPFYAALFESTGSMQAVIDAGFIDDGFHIPAIQYIRDEENLRWFDLPLAKIRRNIEKGRREDKRRKAVLVTTGAFSPIHEGHKDMMEYARECVEANGWNVVGGFFSPSHDGYVSVKSIGQAECPASKRITWCEQAVETSDWLEVDTWEARYVPGPVNFTDVFTRIEHAMAYRLCYPGENFERKFDWSTEHNPPEHCIDVFYVFGGDNAGFARAFLERGHAVCVPRPGSNKHLEVALDPAVIASGRVFFSRCGDADIASTKVRRGKTDQIAEGARLDASHWYDRRGRTTQENSLYLIRDEGSLAVEHWDKGRDVEQLRAAYSVFRDHVSTIIEDAFLHAPRSTPVEIRTMDVERQRAAALEAVGDEKILSLDVYVDGHANLDISRVFLMSSGQWRPREMSNRPGTPRLKKQLKAIEPGDYVLIEDDVATGHTLRQVKAMLPEGVNITREVILTDFCDDGHNNENFLDVVDLRDFLVGSAHGGLCVETSCGNTVRAPYMLPYVNLRSRAKIPPASEVTASRSLWRANLMFFNAITPAITLAEASEGFQALVYTDDFGDRDTMSDICQMHLTKLGGLYRH